MIMCEGGSQCLNQGRRNGNFTCTRIGHVDLEGDCTKETDCLPPVSNCVEGKCKPEVIRDRYCPGLPKNCSRLESCVCGESGKENSCLPAQNQCSDYKIFKEWRDCWELNNCPYEKNIFTALLTDPFQKQT
jgi:hypothetical protein